MHIGQDWLDNLTQSHKNLTAQNNHSDLVLIESIYSSKHWFIFFVHDIFKQLGLGALIALLIGCCYTANCSAESLFQLAYDSSSLATTYRTAITAVDADDVNLRGVAAAGADGRVDHDVVVVDVRVLHGHGRNWNWDSRNTHTIIITSVTESFFGEWYQHYSTAASSKLILVIVCTTNLVIFCLKSALGRRGLGLASVTTRQYVCVECLLPSEQYSLNSAS